MEHQQHEKIQDLLSGSINGHFIDPQQSLNYLECHDNATLYDYFQLQNPNMSHHDQKRAASFGLQLILISQGLVFIHSGQEFFRTKDGLDNTYNSPDAINQLDWTRAVRYQNHIQFISDIIRFRKSHPILSQESYYSIEESCTFYWLSEFVLRYEVHSERETIQFIINFSTQDYHFTKGENQEVHFTYPPLVDKSTQEFHIAGQSICTLVEKKS